MLNGCSKSEDRGATTQGTAGQAAASQGPASQSAASQGSAGVELQTDDQKTIYAIGIALSQNVANFNLKHEEIEILKQGILDGLSNAPKKADFDTYRGKIQQFAQARAALAAETTKKAAQPFLEKAAKESGAKKTESGLIYQEIKAGSGDQPLATDKVKVNYHGTLIDGTVFDSSVERGQPVTFPLNGVIKCWTEGVQLMKVGGKAKLICPPDIAYGDRSPSPKIPPGATLIFEVELLEIEK
ncbi:MAG: FKBP-type peptidyl-prolyl cis-trans isomerase [Deltaproteobacteria bacterium]|nr:FKBP-type peptidyl-prolyl cis-trans isomerase [Deltaproteobacteria bacterium]